MKLARILILVSLLVLPAQIATANPGAIYAATNNGVFKSSDGGGSWIAANSGLGGINVFSLVVDPSKPATLYAGTLSQGVYKSIDGGQNWIAAKAGLDPGTNVLSLAIDPSNTSTIYAGTAGGGFFPGKGVVKSIDGGLNWTVSNSGLPNAIIDVLAIDPFSSAIIYAGTNFAGVFKSTDGGQNWTAANTGMNPALVGTLVVDPANSAILYAGTEGCSSNCLNPEGVFKSTDGGTSWTTVNSGITDLQVISLAVDPSNSNVLYAGTRLHGVFKSVDAGANWSPVNSGLQPTLFAIDHLPLIIDPLNPGTVYAGTDNGVFKSTDGGISWAVANAGFPASTSVFALTVEPAAPPTIAAPLYFPHVETSPPWQTEIAIINASSDQTVTGTLRAFNDEGALIETKDVTLSARGRRQITIADEFTQHTAIGYIIFDTDSDAVQGYMKFYRQGIDRAAIPAVKEVNTSDIYIPFINSSADWWTGLILLNTTSTTKELTITFNTGQIAHYTLNANQHRAFPIESLFNYEPQPNIQSAVITNASGIIGLEVIGDNFGAFCGIPLTGNTASTLYFPYVTATDGWWTGIAAYNPSASACTITITPYDAQGNPFSPQTFYVDGKQTFMGVVSALGLPAQTAWLKIDSTQPLTGLEVFGNAYLHQVAAYAGVVGTGLKTGIFAKIEKNGWTGIYFVNTEATAASVILTAYNDTGTAVATRVLPVGGHANVVTFPENIFSQDISSATYIAYSSDRNIVGFQLNTSSDGIMLDGLPVLAGVGTPAPGTVTLTSGNVAIPVNVSTSSSGPAPPSGFQLGSPPTYFNIGTTETYTPPVTVCIAYDPAPYPDPNLLRLLHYEGDTWLDVTTSNDVAGHTICGRVNSLSPFLIAQKTNNPPVIAAVSATPAVLWPPNNKMVDVSINYSATDDWDQPVCQISSVTANEQIISSDHAVVDAHHIKLRAARLGGGNGRIYTVTISCRDTSGKSSDKTVNVSVPHDQGKK